MPSVVWPIYRLMLLERTKVVPYEFMKKVKVIFQSHEQINVY